MSIYKILIISEISNYEATFVRHYSLVKGFDLAKGFVENNHNVYYGTVGKEHNYNGINFIKFNNMTFDVLNDMDYIIFIRETNIFDLLNYINIEKILFCETRKCKIIMKSDSLSWIFNYGQNDIAKSRYNCEMTYLVKKFYDYLCVQNNDYLLSERKKFKKNKLLSKIIISPMGVSDTLPVITNEYYDVNHSYCQKTINNIKSLCALYPYPVLSYDEKQMEIFNKPKKRLLYFGRLKTDGGKILNYISAVMKILKDEYELHIYPGSVIINGVVCSSKNLDTLEKLRNEIFRENDNIIVHTPFDHKDLHIISDCDVAIDFSPSRPNDKKCLFHNAKLLEYCYMGLKVVTERNVGNSFLIDICKNGSVIDGVPDPYEYADRIVYVYNMKHNREYTINKTIELYGWKKISKELLEKIK